MVGLDVERSRPFCGLAALREIPYLAYWRFIGPADSETKTTRFPRVTRTAPQNGARWCIAPRKNTVFFRPRLRSKTPKGNETVETQIPWLANVVQMVQKGAEFLRPGHQTPGHKALALTVIFPVPASRSRPALPAADSRRSAGPDPQAP
jgi:hypothetical protein